MKSNDWYEDEQFWAAVEPFLFDENRMEIALDEVADIVNLVPVGPGQLIFDQAVGIGRHAEAFAKLGANVLGIDRTRRYLDVARRRCADLPVELVEADMRTRVAENAQLVINLFSSFGFFEDSENLEVAKNAYASLQPGGHYVVELLGKELLAQGFEAERFMERDGKVLLERVRIEDDWAFVVSEWTILDGNSRITREIRLRSYSGVELKSLLYAAGFDEVTLYGGLDGSPYDLDAERLVAVGVRH